MTDKIICEKCGTEMLDLSTEYSITIECPKCGWGWATTLYDTTLDDKTDYVILLTPGNTQTIEVIRLIAEIANVNYLQAKKILSSEAPVTIFKAQPISVAYQTKVHQIQAIARRLQKANVQFSISPDFPYEI